MSAATPTPRPLVGQAEAFIRQAIEGLQPAYRPLGRGRPRLLPSLCLWAGFMICVLHGFSSQRALWRLITQKGLWHYPRFAISDQAIYNRLAREGPAPLHAFFEHLSALLHARLSALPVPPLAPFATDVFALDETTLDQVARRLPAQKNAQPKDLLAGKLAALFDVRLQQWHRVQFRTDTRANEKGFAREMVAGLAPGTLLLADMGYFGFAWFDHLTEAGYYWISRLRAGTSYEIVHVLAQSEHYFDALIFLGAYRADRAAHAVRLVRYRYKEREFAYLTNVRDPGRLSARDIARLYSRRWDIEMAFSLLKKELGLHVFWSSKAPVVEAQVWAVLAVAQVLQALRAEVAYRAGVDLFEVSMPLLVEWMPRFAADGEDPVAVFVERGRQAGFIRPSSRVVLHVPETEHLEWHDPPASLVLRRTPRYAQRRCGPRRPETNLLE